jgi:NAD(P)-dependent dehydrogenase (short-subunit alcohol dehydrogenase family)
MKRVLVIGATGTIGQAICQELKRDTDIIAASYSRGDYQVDISDSDSIKKLYADVGVVDAVICAAARGVKFDDLPNMQIDDYKNSMQSKLWGQIDVVLQGMPHISAGGSFTLTTGILNKDPILQGTAAAVANAAIEGFMQAAAMDMPNGQRINVVSPALLTESQAQLGDYFPGYTTVAAVDVAKAYRKSVYAGHTARIYHVL